ncbi:mannose-6-phosphate isomerase [Vallitaleaceae bacterium 9-2]
MKELLKEPVKLTSERAWRTYVGGRNIDEFTNCDSPKDSNFPELWIMSTTKASNSCRKNIDEGKSQIIVAGKIDKTLTELVKEYPNEVLGKKYAQLTRNEIGVLTKIIDSKERLTIQAHPTKQKAKKYFNSNYGKTEAWHILDTRDDNACIYLGFKENVVFEEFKNAFYAQNLDEMLGMLHKINVKKNETYLIPGGFPHAIGANCMLIEIQEPTDYTLRVEKTTPFGLKIEEMDCHQGIGTEAMFDCFDQRGYSFDEVIDQCRISHEIIDQEKNSIQPIISYEDTECFSLDKIIIRDQMVFQAENEFYGLFIYEGNGKYIVDDINEKQENELKKGDTVLITSNCQQFIVHAKPKEEIVLYKIKGQNI